MLAHSYIAGIIGIPLFTLIIAFAGQPASRSRRLKVEPKVTGLLTTRIKGNRLSIWAEMERLVLATNHRGQPLYPTIHELWQVAEQSGHAIHIELQKPRQYNGLSAGRFRLEKFDPLGARHEMVIKLRLSVINDAVAAAKTVRANGFRPFRGLSRMECYVEVLGHELAHVAWALQSFARMRQLEEMIEETNRLLLAHYRQPKRGRLSHRLIQRLDQRDAFLKEVEAHAEAIEEQIWLELIRGKKSRRKNQPHTVAVQH